MKFSMYNTIADLVTTEKGRAALARYIPGWERYGYLTEDATQSLPLSAIGTRYRFDGYTAEAMQQIVDAMNGPLEDLVPEAASRRSLDELDEESFAAGPRPLSGDATPVALTRAAGDWALPCREVLALDGEWALAADVEGRADWADAVPAPVPGSVHTALVNAGRLPDTTFGRNQELGRLESYKNWYLKRVFDIDPNGACELAFDGVANKCTVWLNGELLGGHEGMFGGPRFDVTGKLKARNELIVKLDAIPEMPYPQPDPASGVRPNLPNNQSWKYTVVSNNVYGWHYSCMPSLGIWNSVRIERVPDVALPDPFIATHDYAAGEMRLLVEYVSRVGAWSGEIRGRVEPANFEGDAYDFALPLADVESGRALLSFQIPDARLWWPNGLGGQPLYRLALSALPGGGLTAETREIEFGVRDVRMAPLPYGKRPDRFLWQFVVNGRPAFIKGTGWCTMDAMMDFSDERYDRFLSLARDQHCQMIRAWGAGMPEKDIFYRLCDRYGIMVMQEWPTAWDSHETQPYEMLEETVVLNTLRIRNHPSLILYCPGNESPNPFGRAIDMMGRLSVELDGTRPFHRGEPYGGSVHNYYSYWNRQSLDFHATMQADFFGEFGIACMPVKESAERYLPDDEKGVWPARPYGAFEYHTPIFGTAEDLSRLSQTSGYFTPDNCSFDQMIVGSQLSQVIGVRHTLERGRIRYPDCGGALYYKLNDNFPAMSWATVDWYGAPKIGHYAIMKSFWPVAAMPLVSTMNFAGTVHSLPIFLTDDNGAPDARYRVSARAYDGNFRLIARQTYAYEGDVRISDRVGALSFRYEDTLDAPILLYLTVEKNGEPAYDNFYFFNYEARKGCLFDLPQTRLSLSVRDGQAIVRNEGAAPAVGVWIERPGHAHEFTASENFLWLEPGAEKQIAVNCAEGLFVSALNAKS
ncbi:MAG: beta-mannosidase [Clostridiales bacterium]|nr:beta-mannosidase [Clostridiales bacterium]